MNVAFLIYKRPDLTRRVFDVIATARPSKLLVVADGPKDEAEVDLCAEARSVINDVNWPCEVLTHFADFNMGCKKRISTGLDWVFSVVNEAVILEDDCLPHPSFFPYCQAQLKYFRDDERVGHITGNNFLGGYRQSQYSYYFSIYSGIWGWATWRRAWEHYDSELGLWPTLRDEGWHHNLFPTRREAAHFEKVWNDCHAGLIDTWDMQWFFHRLIQGAYTVVPCVNLVANIGFRADGTHTSRKTGRANIPAEPMLMPLVRPPFVICDRAADREYVKRFYSHTPIKRYKVYLKHFLLNRHWYGQFLRRLPIVGPIWARWRGGC